VLGRKEERRRWVGWAGMREGEGEGFGIFIITIITIIFT
jgi:hypothetical protein